MTDGGIFFIAGAPFWVIFAAAVCIAFGRTQIIYWAGRGLAAGTLQSRWSRHLEGQGVQKAIRMINRWGPAAVTLSFLTVGVQTVVNLTAGYTRMPFWRYVAALIPGSFIWAAIWTTIGAVAFRATMALAATSPLGLALIAASLIGLGTWFGWRAHRRRHQVDAGTTDPANENGEFVKVEADAG